MAAVLPASFPARIRQIRKDNVFVHCSSDVNHLLSISSSGGTDVMVSP